MIAILLAFAALVALPAIYLRDRAQERHRRAGYFQAVLGLFDSYQVTQQGAAWPVLEGRYRGRTVRLEPVLDDMAWRKIPSLWLKATLLAPNARRGMLGLLVRARGGEFYSPTAEMRHRLRKPASFPADAILYSDCAQTAPIEAAESQIDAFDDPRMKELVITPLGVRLVYQAAQADRSSYLVLRQARFEGDAVNPALVRTLLDRVLAVAHCADVGVDSQPKAA